MRVLLTGVSGKLAQKVALELLRRGHGVADRGEVLAPIDGDDVGAFLGEPNRMTPALPASSTGDECNLALYSSH